MAGHGGLPNMVTAITLEMMSFGILGITPTVTPPPCRVPAQDEFRLGAFLRSFREMFQHILTPGWARCLQIKVCLDD